MLRGRRWRRDVRVWRVGEIGEESVGTPALEAVFVVVVVVVAVGASSESESESAALELKLNLKDIFCVGVM